MHFCRQYISHTLTPALAEEPSAAVLIVLSVIQCLSMYKAGSYNAFYLIHKALSQMCEVYMQHMRLKAPYCRACLTAAANMGKLKHLPAVNVANLSW